MERDRDLMEPESVRFFSIKDCSNRPYSVTFAGIFGELYLLKSLEIGRLNVYSRVFGLSLKFL
jgi:hypothetical protein